MKNALATLKSPKVWIPLSIFLVLFFGIAGCTYFFSRAINEVSEETPQLPINDLVLAAIDPVKSKHLAKAEYAFFDAEKYAAEKDYRRAHEGFIEAAEQFEAATGSTSSVTCIMLLRLAEFETKYHKWDAAEATLHKAMTNLPKGENSAELTFTVNRWLGYVLQCHEKYDQAIPVFVANVTLGQQLDQAKHVLAESNRRVALRCLSSCYVAAKQYDKATKASTDFLAIVQTLPDNQKLVTDAWIELGRIKTYPEKYSEAIGYYNKALATDPRCIEAFRLRGIAYNEMKQYRNAINDFTLILQVDGKDENAYQWRAYVYELGGQNDRAIADLTAAIKLGGEDESVYDNRARLFAEAGRYKEAIADYGASIALEDSPWTYLYRAQAYDQLAQHQAAIADYTKALESSYFVKHPNRTEGDKIEPKTQKTMGALVYEKRAKCYAALGKQNLAEADRAKSAQLDAAAPESKTKSKLQSKSELGSNP